jgi:hypothetical protein
MKKIILSLSLLLAACEGGKSSETPEVKPQVEVAPVFENSSRQYLKVQDTIVRVTRANVELSFGNRSIWMLIETPTQKFGFSYTSAWGENTAKIESLDQKKIQTLEALTVFAEESADLEIDRYRELATLRNILDLDRCRTAPVWKELVSLVKPTRDIVYFQPRFSTDPEYALRWSMTEQKFLNMVKTIQKDSYRYAGNSKVSFSLTPLASLRDENGKIFRDSAFLSFYRFLDECDEYYGDEPDNEDYLPRYEITRDELQSVAPISQMTFDQAVGLVGPIYSHYFRGPTADDLEYARSSNILKENNNDYQKNGVQ